MNTLVKIFAIGWAAGMVIGVSCGIEPTIGYVFSVAVASLLGVTAANLVWKWFALRESIRRRDRIANKVEWAMRHRNGSKSN